MKNYLSIILFKLLRASQGYNTKEIYANTKKQMIAKKTLDYIEHHYKEKISLTISNIVVEAGFCDIKFYYRFFQKHMGLTPGEFRRKILLDENRRN